MARRKKRKGRTLNQTDSPRGEDAFNPVFKGLGALKQKSEDIAQEPKKKVPLNLAQSLKERLFTEAMSGVTPLSENNRIIAKAPDMETRPAHPPNISDLETLAHLSDLVSGTAEMDITF